MDIDSRFSVTEIQQRLLSVFNEVNRSKDIPYFYGIESEKTDQEGNKYYILKVWTYFYGLKITTRKVHLKISPTQTGSVVDFKLGRGTSILLFVFTLIGTIAISLALICLIPILMAFLVPFILAYFGVTTAMSFSSDHIRSGNISLKLIRDCVCNDPKSQKAEYAPNVPNAPSYLYQPNDQNAQNKQNDPSAQNPRGTKQ